MNLGRGVDDAGVLLQPGHARGYDPFHGRVDLRSLDTFLAADTQNHDVFVQTRGLDKGLLHTAHKAARREHQQDDERRAEQRRGEAHGAAAEVAEGVMEWKLTHRGWT